jgi:hypothetical protein
MMYSSYKKGYGLVTHSTYIPPKNMFLNLPRYVIRSTARFRLLVHTLRFETATWNQSDSPTCDLCNTDDVQDEQHVLFHCTNPHVRDFSPQEICISVSPNRSPRCVYFLKPETITSFVFSFMNLKSLLATDLLKRTLMKHCTLHIIFYSSFGGMSHC